MYDWKSFFFWKMRRSASNRVMSPQLCILWAVGLFLQYQDGQRVKLITQVLIYFLRSVECMIFTSMFFKYRDTCVIKQRHFPPCVLSPLSDVKIKTRLLLFCEHNCFSGGTPQTGLILSVPKSEQCLVFPKNQRC